MGREDRGEDEGPRFAKKKRSWNATRWQMDASQEERRGREIRRDLTTRFIIGD